MVGRIFLHCYDNSYTIPLVLFCILTEINLIRLVTSQEYEFGDTSQLCWKNLPTQKWLCRPVCQHGYFSLPGMEYCMQWLDCKHLNTDIDVGNMIGQGAIKMVFKAFWKNYTLALNIAARKEYYPDFRHGKSMIMALQPNPHFIQLIGTCGIRYLTEYHPLTSADNFLSYITSTQYKHFDSLELRYQLCLDYVHIVALLHNSPIGTRVLCDSNDPKKTLSQFLLRSDFRLIINDMDALPEVNHTANQLIKCGHREIGGDFVAPEQLWPYPYKNFTDEEMPPYDEKTDIWKIPNICNHFLGSMTEAIPIKLRLLHVHSQCKEEDPKLRPTAREVASEYKKAWTLYKKEQRHKTEL